MDHCKGTGERDCHVGEGGKWPQKGCPAGSRAAKIKYRFSINSGISEGIFLMGILAHEVREWLSL